MKLEQCFWNQIGESLHFTFDSTIDTSFDVLNVYTKDDELIQKLKPQHLNCLRKILPLIQQDVDANVLLQYLFPGEHQEDENWCGNALEKFKLEYVSDMRRVVLNELRKNKVSIKAKPEDEIINQAILPKITRKWSHPKFLFSCFKKLVLRNRGILVIDAKFQEQFETSHSLTELNLSNNQISIVQYIPSQLKTLDLFYNKFCCLFFNFHHSYVL